MVGFGTDVNCDLPGYPLIICAIPDPNVFNLSYGSNASNLFASLCASSVA